MKIGYMKRSASLLLVLAVFLSFTLATTLEVNAAAKTKTFYVTTEMKSTSTFKEKGQKTYKYSSLVKYSYDKNGLRTKITRKDGSYTQYTRNKNGYAIRETEYDKSGNPTFITESKYNKNGDVVKETNYYFPDGKKTKSTDATFTYYGKGKLKKIVSKDSDGKSTSNYNKKGFITKSTSKYGKYTNTDNYKYKYDSKGNPTKITTTSTTNGKNKVVRTETIKYTYKKGNIAKQTSTEVTKDKKGKVTSRYQSTTAFTYKGKNLVKVVTTSKTKTSTYKDTTTFKYKKVKVPKKYWKLFA